MLGEKAGRVVNLSRLLLHGRRGSIAIILLDPGILFRKGALLPDRDSYLACGSLQLQIALVDVCDELRMYFLANALRLRVQSRPPRQLLSQVQVSLRTLLVNFALRFEHVSFLIADELFECSAL